MADEPPRRPEPAPPPHAAVPEAQDRRHAEESDAGRIAPRMLEALVCPLTGARLQYDADRGELVSKSAGLAFPIRSGIPIMLVDEARKLDG